MPRRRTRPPRIRKPPRLPELPEPVRFRPDFTHIRERALHHAFECLGKPFFEREAIALAMHDFISSIPMKPNRRHFLKILERFHAQVIHLEYVHTGKRAPYISAKDYYKFFLEYVSAMEEWAKLSQSESVDYTVQHLHANLDRIRTQIAKGRVTSYSLDTEYLYSIYSNVNNAIYFALEDAGISPTHYAGVREFARKIIFDVSAQASGKQPLN